MKTNIKSLICKSAAMLAIASSAYAVPLNNDAIRYSTDGINWSTVVFDNNLPSGDFNPGDNHITTLIIAPGLTLNVTSTANTTGSASSPNMDIGLDGSIGSGTVYVEYSDIGFTPVPTGSYHTHFGVTDSGSVTASAYTIIGSGATANTLFSGADFADLTSLTPIGPLSGNTSGDQYLPPGTTAPYAITLVQVISAGKNGGGISTDARVTVPDGGNTLMLLGSALSVLGFGAFRKSRKA